MPGAIDNLDELTVSDGILGDSIVDKMMTSSTPPMAESTRNNILKKTISEVS